MTMQVGAAKDPKAERRQIRRWIAAVPLGSVNALEFVPAQRGSASKSTTSGKDFLLRFQALTIVWKSSHMAVGINAQHHACSYVRRSSPPLPFLH